MAEGEGVTDKANVDLLAKKISLLSKPDIVGVNFGLKFREREPLPIISLDPVENLRRIVEDGKPTFLRRREILVESVVRHHVSKNQVGAEFQQGQAYTSADQQEKPRLTVHPGQSLAIDEQRPACRNRNKIEYRDQYLVNKQNIAVRAEN